MARLSARRSPRCRPGVSTKASCTPGRLSMPSTRWRVVCGRDVTIESFSPTSAFSSVDLPTLGRPDERGETRAESWRRQVLRREVIETQRLSALPAPQLLGAPAARALALGLERRHAPRRRRPGTSAHAVRRWCA